MIGTADELRGAQRQIAELEEILDEMKRAETPESYLLLCKSYVRRIRRIRREIDEYLGIRLPRAPLTAAMAKTS